MAPKSTNTRTMFLVAEFLLKALTRRVTSKGTPVNELPPEVLAQIFEAGTMWIKTGFLPENSFAHNPSVLKEYAPMAYLGVCRYWREVALSTPSLWTYCSSAQFFPKTSIVPAMKYWLDRSGPTAPLDLQLEFQNNFPPLYANNIFRLLATEVKRWRSMSIELDLSLAQEFAALLEEQTQDLHQLEELEIQLLPEGVPVPLSQRILAQIPFLKSLRCFTWVVYGYDSREHVFRQLPVLAVLDDVSLRIPSLFDECIAHLSQCASATKVRLYDKTCHYQPLERKPAFPITTLPCLTFLNLTRYWDAIDVLDYFTLPSLEHLKIEIVQNHAPGHNLSILRNFLERSKCPLRLLAIEGDFLESDSTLTDYLLFPSIRSIPEVHITCEFVATMAIDILETYPNAESAFPPILCWLSNDHWFPQPWIGWKDLVMGEKFIFSWAAGKLDLTTDKYLIDDHVRRSLFMPPKQISS